ncbi:hypothetical protein [Pseudonocardia sp. DLS-67]
MIDGGVIAAYLAVAVGRGGRRSLDRVVDGALDRLTDGVARRLGPRPAAELAKDPYDGATLAEVTRAIDAVARHDSRFGRELGRLRRQLDKHGGWRLVNQVRARTGVQVSGRGIVAGRDVTANDPHPGQVLAWVGIVVALAGFSGWMYLILTGFGPAAPPDLEPGVPLAPAAVGAFLAGGLLYGFGVAFSRAARRRGQEEPPWARRR